MISEAEYLKKMKKLSELQRSTDKMAREIRIAEKLGCGLPLRRRSK